VLADLISGTCLGTNPVWSTKLCQANSGMYATGLIS